MNYSSAELSNTTQRQGRLLGPLLGFFLASLFPSLAIARLQHGSIKFQYDPAPLAHPNQPPLINVFQTSEPTRAPTNKQPERIHLESTVLPEHYVDGPEGFPDIVPTDYLIPENSNTQKVAVKRAVSSRYVPAYRRNRYNTRRKFPAYFDYENYDYFNNLRLRERRRNQGRLRPAGFDYDYDYDYDSSGRSQKKKQQRRRIKNNRNYADYYSDEEFDNDVEPVTVRLRPRQQATTTTDVPDTTTTVITNGTTPGTAANNSTPAGYGYGSSNGNENISITYGPPSAIKPVYGVPGVAHGTPLTEWSPSYAYEPPNSYSSQHQGSYYSGSSYHSPSSYATLSSSYTPQGGSYPQSVSYGVPSTSYGTPGQSSSQSSGFPSGRASGYQSYQLPFSSWYGGSASHSDIVRRAQDIAKYD